MKRIPIAILVFIVLGCSSSQKQEQNIALVEKFVDAVEASDVTSMSEMLADNYQGLGPSVGDSTDKESAVAAWKANSQTLYKKINYDRSRNIAVSIKQGPNQGDWVSNWAALTIEYHDGRGPITIWANTLYQIENGKIVKSYTIYNEADALRQLGYVFINPNEL